LFCLAMVKAANVAVAVLKRAMVTVQFHQDWDARVTMCDRQIAVLCAATDRKVLDSNRQPDGNARPVLLEHQATRIGGLTRDYLRS
jgi:hypothetical protein